MQMIGHQQNQVGEPANCPLTERHRFKHSRRDFVMTQLIPTPGLAADRNEEH